MYSSEQHCSLSGCDMCGGTMLVWERGLVCSVLLSLLAIHGCCLRAACSMRSRCLRLLPTGRLKGGHGQASLAQPRRCS